MSMIITFKSIIEEYALPISLLAIMHAVQESLSMILTHHTSQAQD